MAWNIGQMETFDVAGKKLAYYMERLEQYFEANEISSEKHIAALLAIVGGKTYSLAHNLIVP